MVSSKLVKIQKKTESKLQADIYDVKGKVIGKTALLKEIFATKVNPYLLAQAVRVYLANQRQGTHSTKTRGEVTGSTRKIYRQKGTGRARHGDIKAPIFIGGGITFGPKPRDHSLSLSEKMRKKALFSALTNKFQAGEIKIISGLENMNAKTKEMEQIFKNLKLVERKTDKQAMILLVLPSKLDNIFFAGRNLDYLTLGQAKLLNTYEVLTHKNLLFTKEALSTLVERFNPNKKNANPIQIKTGVLSKTNKPGVKKKTSRTKEKTASIKKIIRKNNHGK